MLYRFFSSGCYGRAFVLISMPDVFKKLLILFWHAGFQQN